MNIPSGVVTLLFSDVEGSTRLLDSLGATYLQVLDDQRAIQRSAWAAEGGVELGAEGDGFYVAFAETSAAVRAAVSAQRGLDAHPWPTGVRLRVRMGVHVGAPTRHADAYVGMDVHRAARVAASAHGGQIVVTEAVAIQVRRMSEIDLVSLGNHRLKDLPRPERLFQIIADGLADHFPPLRTLGSTSSIPRTTGPLLGRKAELARLTDLLHSGAPRLITLTGPGGTGKTRLAVGAALAAAANADRPVSFVSLEAVDSAAAMTLTILKSLDEIPTVLDAVPPIPDYLANGGLLVLDNLEQVTGAAEVVSAMLTSAPSLQVLATSRVPLRCDHEVEIRVAQLDLPRNDDLAEVSEASAVQLFVHHAQAARADFRLDETNVGDVADICRILDGLPLAIELAAARIRMLAPAGLRERVGSALDLKDVAGRRPKRQQTLRSAIRWSYDLLDDDQRAMLRLLAPLTGGAGSAMIESIATTTHLCATEKALELCEELADASLARVVSAGGSAPRVQLLNTVRAFALSELAAEDERAAVHMALMSFLGTALNDPCARSSRYDLRRDYALRIEEEYNNITAVLDWLVNEADWQDTAATEIAGRLSFTSAAVHQCGVFGGHGADAEKWARQVLDLCPDASPDQVAPMLVALAEVLTVLGRFDQVRLVVDRARNLVSGWANPCSPCAEHDWVVPRLLMLDGVTANIEGRVAVSQQLLGRVLEHSTADSSAVTWSLLNLASIERAGGRPRDALALERRAASVAAQSGDFIANIAARNNSACTLRALGELQQSWDVFLALMPDVLDSWSRPIQASVGEDLCCLLIDMERFHEAGVVMGAVEANRQRYGTVVDAVQDAVWSPLLLKAEGAGPQWHEGLRDGRALSVEEAIRTVMDLRPERPTPASGS